MSMRLVESWCGACVFFFFFQAEDGIRDVAVTGVQTCALLIFLGLDLKGIGVSAGSACTAGNIEPSHVLVAMGVPLDWAMGAVRCSLGRSTTAEDIDYVIECMEPLVRRLRQAMPVGAA